MSTSLRLHAFLPLSRANGPGTRAVIWAQGCSLGCPGCFNPQTHALSGGEVILVEEVFQRVARLGPAIEGITLSGGEPLQQREAMAELLARIRCETNLSVLVFTGYTWEEVSALPQARGLLASVDVLVAGRYVAAERVARGLRGSGNKTVHLLTPRYSLADLQAVPEAEVFVGPNGEVSASGIGPLRLG
ncbi:MAG: 4Fe-4S single cluster domain-containing protein [Verrucomicrobia bacterium]|nr:4Fe-4S single cluster domain-containing protein [Verrucomicrobiota bacterium]